MVSISPMKITTFVESSSENLNQMEITVPIPSQQPKKPSTNTSSEEPPSLNHSDTSSISPNPGSDSKIKVPSKKSRRRSCGICAGCRRDDCGQCVHCRAMVKFGGNGKMKKRCKNRDCENMNKNPNSFQNGIDKFFSGLKSPEATPTSMHNDVAMVTPSPMQSMQNKRPLPMDDEDCVKKAKFEVSEDIFGTPSSDIKIDMDMTHSNDSIQNPKESTPLKTFSPEVSVGTSKATFEQILKPSCNMTRSIKIPMSPAKHYLGSPRQYSSPKKNPFLKQINKASPRKSSIQFGIIKKEEIGPSIDHAPFKNLVHVCQGHLQVTGTGTSVLNRIGMRPEPSIPHIRVGNESSGRIFGTGACLRTGMGLGTGIDLGTRINFKTGTILGMETNLRMGTRLSSLCNRQMPPSHKELLHQIKTTNPNENVDKIIARYNVIKKQLDLLQIENEKTIKDQFTNQSTNKEELSVSSCQVDGKKNNVISIDKSRKRRRNGQSPPVELHCTIHIIRNSKEGTILVDTDKYQESSVGGRGNLRSRSPSRRRASFRQAQERIQSELALDKENKKPESLSRIKTPPTDKSSSEDNEVSIIGVESKETHASKKTRPFKDTPVKESQPISKVEEDHQPKEIPSCSFGTQLWNDLYRPNNTSDLIGNKDNTVKVCNWLSKWKTKSINSNSKEKTNSNVDGGKGSSQDGDPDFKVPSCRRRRVRRSVSLDESFNSSNCSNDAHYDDEVGVALLLCGPCGCGKTATVYTCANELGYKVMEINSTDNRTRQSLSSVLREATQSHHVGVKQSQPSITMATTVTTLPPTDKKEKKGGLMAFFKPKPKKKVIKETILCDKQVSLETTTVTLLEEVDLICEDEAKGFWTSILEIVSNTKRPLIFTANDPEMELPFRHTKIMFQPPPTEALSLHCQLLSMSYDIHMSKKEADQITSHAHNDLRKLFNDLNFYLLTSSTKSNVRLNKESIKGQPSEHQSSGSLHRSLSDCILGIINIESTQSADQDCLDSTLHAPSSDYLNLLHCYDPHLSECILPSAIPSMTTTPTTNELYSQLDHCVQIASTLSSCDVITKSHDCYTISHDPHTPWWSSHVTSSLIDELELESGDNETTEYRGYMEALLLNLVPGPVYTGMEERKQAHFKLPNNQIIRQSHECHMTCCEVFDVRMELNRYPLMTECLPFLHVICASEEDRKSSGQSRRFTHYLSSCEVSLDTLRDFFRICSYHK